MRTLRPCELPISMRVCGPHPPHTITVDHADLLVFPSDITDTSRGSTGRASMTRKPVQRANTPIAANRSPRFRHARNQQRTARRLASRSSAVSMWWDALRQPRPEFFTPMSLSLALGGPTNGFAAALRWLGWRNTVRRVHGTKVTLWLPPTTTIKPRPVGRPRIYAP
jgi:hypothetical protein